MVTTTSTVLASFGKSLTWADKSFRVRKAKAEERNFRQQRNSSFHRNLDIS